MLKHILIAAVVISSTQTWWAIFGPMEVSTMTAQAMDISTGPIKEVILKSSSTPDCYRLTVQPNGTIGTEWVTCP